MVALPSHLTICPGAASAGAWHARSCSLNPSSVPTLATRTVRRPRFASTSDSFTPCPATTTPSSDSASRRSPCASSSACSNLCSVCLSRNADLVRRIGGESPAGFAKIREQAARGDETAREIRDRAVGAVGAEVVVRRAQRPRDFAEAFREGAGG